MSGNRSIFTTFIAVGLGCAASSVYAQNSGFGSFGMSLHNQLSQPQQYDLGSTVQFESFEFGSIVVLLDNPTEQASRFSDMGSSDSDPAGQRGQSQRGIDARDSFTPKPDNLFVVPLPPAAFAGFGLLAGVAGVRCIRRIKR